MKKILIVIMIAAFVTAAAALSFGKSRKSREDRYRNVDMTKVTCSDLLNEKDTQAVTAVLIWIDGYFSAKTGDMVVDVNQLKRLADRLEGYCRDNPETPILEAVKKSRRRKY